MPDLSGIFHSESLDILDGVVDGDWIMDRIDPINKWQCLREEGFTASIPKHEYYSLPWGRISYNSHICWFLVRHGGWLRPEHERLIIGDFKLPVDRTIFEYDELYRV